MPARIAVFASGGGTNLQALIDAFHPRPDPPARVELLIASRAGIGAVARAEAAAIPVEVLSAAILGAEALSREMLRALDEHRIDLIVLAGYLQMVPPEVVDRYRNRIVNIHPALLPGFGGKGMYGLRVHRAVVEAGVRISGATVHLVDERYDEGRILAQWPVPVLPDDTPQSLAARVLRVEHRLLPVAVEALVCGGDTPPLQDPLCFEVVAQPAPAADSVSRLAAATCR